MPTVCLLGKMEEKPKNISKPGLRWFWIISVGYQVILLATLVCIVLYTTKLTHQVKILREKSVNNNEMRSHGQSATKIRVNGDLNDKLFDEPERREVIAGGRKYYGPQGPPGADGQDGAAGPQGARGNTGPRSPKYDQIQAYVDDTMKDTISKVGAKLSKTIAAIPPVNGVTYIRWGHLDCPSPQTEWLYAGRMGGSYYSTGGGYNPQCFPDNPEYLETRANAHSNVRGGEYENQHGTVLSDIRQENIPCAVCQAYDGRMSHLMIPGQVRCPSSWTTEYAGYLMAGRATNRRSEFICVDKDTQVVKGFDSNRDGELMFHVGIDCRTFGSCPPYKDSAELACVVCTR